ncbi:MAG: DNA translocase FtsK 4TM domain-containing protein [Alphaproteobacteria bacterium]|nr:DNA translocase FtsK 4TM domain-containing protein [Alphaproteobacteria bacterium]
MASKYKVKKRQKGFWTRLLPETAQVFLAKRIVDGTAIILCLGGLAILLSILSYSPHDPSLNSVTGQGQGQAVRNWMGHYGANISDLLLQLFGLAGILSGITLVVWGGSLLKRRPLPYFWSRVVALILGTFTASITLAHTPSGDWLDQLYSGGSVGLLLLQKVTDGLSNITSGYEFLLSTLIFGALTMILIGFSWAISRYELKWLASHIWFWASTLTYAITQTAIDFYHWLKHHNNAAPARAQKRLKAQKPVISQPEKEERKTVIAKKTESSDKAIKVVAPQDGTPSDNKPQQRFQLFDGAEWELPSVDLLQDVPEDADTEQMDEQALRLNAELLQNVLSDFNIKGDIVSIHPGPVVTLYELEPAPGTKSSRVIGLADDIARSMSATSVRAAVVPGRNVIGIEIPNKKRQTVYMRDMLMMREYEKSKAKLPMILGKDIGGRPVIADLARMPHLLVAGTTGSGKSVSVNTMILSLLYRLPPEKCRFIMIDPKMLELSVYDDIPHLLSPVVTEPGKAVVALKWVVAEMEERYRSMSKLGVRNIDGYNARLAEARKSGEALMRKVQTGFDPETGKPVFEEQPLDLTDLPYIVVIVDEFADLMLVAGKDVEGAIQRLAQMARAAGIHLIMATQRPSVDVITGVIKANFPTRISFAVTSKIDSRTILGDGGAEQLLGMGDMLYMAAGGQITRAHGPFASDADVENVVNFLKSQSEPSYLDDITEGGGDFTGAGLGGLYGDNGTEDKVDELYDEAVALVARERKASTSFIQRCLQIGYNRAARIVEEMEKQGVIGPANHVGKREVLVSDLSEAS